MLVFEYSNNCFKLWGFKDIKYIDNSKIKVIYKHKSLLVEGNNLVICNLIDQSMEVRGVINKIVMEYFIND